MVWTVIMIIGLFVLIEEFIKGFNVIMYFGLCILLYVFIHQASYF